MTLWKGRIDAGMAEAVADFTVSLPFDRVLARDDLAGSRAHVTEYEAPKPVPTIAPPSSLVKGTKLTIAPP